MHLRSSTSATFSRRVGRRVIGVVVTLVLGLSGTLVGAAAASAASQNEILLDKVFDGTASFNNDPVTVTNTFTGNAAGLHTPGLDESGTNNVVRTWDSLGVRVDWNINEANATGAKLIVVLQPESKAGADVIWSPDQSGMFSGCATLPTSSISADGLTLTCVLKPTAADGVTFTQGSHGVVNPVAKLRSGLDGTTINAVATLVTDQDAVGVSDNLDDATNTTVIPFYVSETARGNWIKNDPVISPELTVSGAPATGYVALFPLSLVSSDQSTAPGKGSGPINTSVPISFLDHAWNLPAGTRVATAAEMGAAGYPGSACGAYAGTGAFPITSGSWTCSNLGSPQGYPVTQLDVTGFSNVAPATNANGSANKAGVVLTGQIALWLPKAAVDAGITAGGGSVKYDNSITSTPAATRITAPATVGGVPTGLVGIQVAGTHLSTVETNIGDNSTFLSFAAGGGTGGNGSSTLYTYHYGIIARDYQPGQFDYLDPSPPRTFGMTERTSFAPGFNGGTTLWNGNGVVSRGMPVNLQYFMSVNTTSTHTEPIHGCLAWDPTQMYLRPMPTFTMRHDPDSTFTHSTYTRQSPTGRFENLFVGEGGTTATGGRNGSVLWRSGTADAYLTERGQDGFQIIVEYGYDDTSTFFDFVPLDGTECNNAAGRHWVASTDTAGLNARLQPNGFYGFSYVRIRTVGDFPWQVLYPNKGNIGFGNEWRSPTAGVYINVAAAIGTDIAINHDNKDVYLHTARARGTWAPATTAQPPTPSCLADPTLGRENNLNAQAPANGWCSQPYAGNESPFGTTPTSLDQGSFTYPTSAAAGSGVLVADGDHDRVRIKVVSPLVTKARVSEPEIVDNGGFVEFEIGVRAAGASVEALTNYVMTDTLPSAYKFIAITQAPSQPATCTTPAVGSTGSIVCRFSEADPTVDTGPLPAGIPGGWSDTMRIKVQVIGGIASTLTLATLTNNVRVDTSQVGPWDPAVGFVNPPVANAQSATASAFSLMPLGSTEGVILKAVDAENGPCGQDQDGVTLSGQALLDWQARCSMITFDADPANLTAVDAVGNMHFDLSYTNTGNTILTGVRIVDVFPFNGDATEPASSSAAYGSSPATLGDGRTPPSNYAGQLGFVGVSNVTAGALAATNPILVTKAAPATISRDPQAALAGTIWCTPAGAVANTAQFPTATAADCPANAFNINPGVTRTVKLALDTENQECDDIWTNTFGSRTDQMRLPVRSNDVSIKTSCKVSVGDYVWFDANNDGRQDGTDVPLEGVTLTITGPGGVPVFDINGNPVTTTTTDTFGHYLFADLPPLPVGQSYTVTVSPPAGYVAAKQNVGDTVLDSSTGSAASTVDLSKDGASDLTLDFGFVKPMNLALAKSLDTPAPIVPGQTVTFTLTPSNTSDVDAAAGWSVTDVLPAGLVDVSATGTDYTCVSTPASGTDPASVTCTSGLVLPKSTPGNPITVTATIDAGTVGASLKNVAYVAPNASDVPEIVPLVVPTLATDTTTVVTDNDAEASLLVDQPVSIGDFVWLDTNRDGIQNEDTPVEGVLVTLYAADGTTVVATTHTLADGSYAFTGLPPGIDYVVAFTAPTGMSFTVQGGAGSTTADDSNVDPATGRTTVTSPATGSNSGALGEADDSTIDAGLVQYNLTLDKTLVTSGTIYAGDTVTFELVPSNDGPTAALAGWSVTEVLPAGLTLVSMEGEGYDCTLLPTCTSGELLMPGPGKPITVKATVGLTFSGLLKNVAYVAPLGTDGVETHPLVVPTTETDTTDEATDNDAEASVQVLPVVSIGDFVWYDVDRDGIQDEGEPAYVGMTVNLLDVDGNVLFTAQTDDAGYYAFPNLHSGVDYQVQFVKADDESFTSQLAGDDRGVDSNPDLVTGIAPVTAPVSGSNSVEPTMADDPTIDAGIVKYNLTLTKTLVPPVGKVYPGERVEFTLTPYNAGPVAALGDWSVTDVLPAGLELVSMEGTGYSCVDLTCTYPGVLGPETFGEPITLTVRVLPDFVGTARNVAYVAPSGEDVPETVPLVVPTTDTDTTKPITDNDAEAALVVDSLVSVGDYVWWDTNRDGLQSAGEAPVSGVTVNLYDAEGTLIGTVVTDEKGFYSFRNLTPEREYVLEFVRPADASFTTTDAGDGETSDGIDSDADVTTGKVSFTAPASGSNSGRAPDNPSIDAGLVKINLTLAKKLTSSGPFALGDSVTFTLTPHNDGPVDALTGWSVTDLLPTQLLLIDMSGTGYTCSVDTATCVSSVPLVAGADGNPILVTAKITAAGGGSMRNVAYVTPVEGDTPETNLLAVPQSTSVDTGETPTDNDSQAELEVTSPSLPRTGTDVVVTVLAGLAMLILGGGLLVLTRRPRPRHAA
jgi:uncharacterized repeat protein (TIGR01451 family)/LPXTG-motif cell wall-anchored protein